jgi:hypothetical protein
MQASYGFAQLLGPSLTAVRVATRHRISAGESVLAPRKRCPSKAALQPRCERMSEVVEVQKRPRIPSHEGFPIHMGDLAR